MSGEKGSQVSKEELQEIINSLPKAQVLAIIKAAVVTEGNRRRRSMKKPDEVPGPVTQYRTILYHTTCKHCGRKWDREVPLREEGNAFITERGNVVVTKRPCELYHYVSKCSHCRSFIRKLKRRDLEERYYALIQQMPFGKILTEANGQTEKVNRA